MRGMLKREAIHVCLCEAQLLQSSQTLCGPTDCSPPSKNAHRRVADNSLKVEMLKISINSRMDKEFSEKNNMASE